MLTFSAGHIRLWANLGIAIGSLAIVGCAARDRAAEVETRSDETRAPIAAIAKPEAQQPTDPTVFPAPEVDPRGYLTRVAAECAKLRSYTLTFTRLERRGLLIQTLQGPEKIRCWFRQKPFSIRMKWIEPPDIKYGESTYVEGHEDDKVRFVPRYGFLGLSPSLTKVSLNTPVVWGEARRPVTDFGLENLMARTLETMTRAGDRVRVSYMGICDAATRPTHHLRLEYAADFTPTPFQDLFIDANTNRPLATEIRLANGDIDASYRYDDLDTSAILGEDDFVLDAERAAEPRAGSTGG